VWVPFTSESKEAIAAYPEIQKELRLGLQAVGRKLGMYLRKRQRVKQEGERRSVFLRYLDEVANAVAEIKIRRDRDDEQRAARVERERQKVLENLVQVAKRKTVEADAKYDKHGKRVGDEDLDLGGSTLIRRPDDDMSQEPVIDPAPAAAKPVEQQLALPYDDTDE
jgi:DNA topoisomerase-6 subunit B